MSSVQGGHNEFNWTELNWVEFNWSSDLNLPTLPCFVDYTDSKILQFTNKCSSLQEGVFNKEIFSFAKLNYLKDIFYLNSKHATLT